MPVRHCEAVYVHLWGWCAPRLVMDGDRVDHLTEVNSATRACTKHWVLHGDHTLTALSALLICFITYCLNLDEHSYELIIVVTLVYGGLTSYVLFWLNVTRFTALDGFKNVNELISSNWLWEWKISTMIKIEPVNYLTSINNHDNWHDVWLQLGLQS